MIVKAPLEVTITSLDDAWAKLREAKIANREIDRFLVTHPDYAALRSRKDILKYYDPGYRPGAEETLFGIPLKRVRPTRSAS